MSDKKEQSLTDLRGMDTPAARLLQAENERLEARVNELEAKLAVLYNGHAVWLEAGNVKGDDVSAVLDAIVRLQKKELEDKANE